jgi:hypothetical protein
MHHRSIMHLESGMSLIPAAASTADSVVKAVRDVVGDRFFFATVM